MLPRAAPAVLLLLLSLGVAAAAPDWPAFGPARSGLHLDGHSNTVPDVVGPVDGSARLTVFTEGNHYPVLLPLLLEDFPAHCRESGDCDVRAEDILVVTLPQFMLVEALTGGALRLGNAVIPLAAEGPVFPDLVMGGARPLQKLAAAGLVADEARVFARHRGMGLLVRRDSGVKRLDDLLAPKLRIVMATKEEAGARRQYQAALTALLDQARAEALLSREIGAFPGRLRIQHRDVPYALMNDLADAGVIFAHLARYYAERLPETLRFVPVDAERFGQTLAVARSRKPSAEAQVFERFLLEQAPTVYPAGGFTPAERFDFGERIRLRP